ncbi:hypothetical protein GCM10007100_06220 [Roseibacillus persicicus]|uniref:Uncharacterized protein n=1 Tax=Roseibacillus persicicus TaxID=454148 RepID=A0A918WEH4_9BACT|nr:hypothetical protein GCM10007100_06220 [Roseibacillus persicicus]
MQALAKEFVCVADECWDLSPPDWFNREWLKTPRSTRLFESYLKKAPEGLIPQGTSTFQGSYCMTAEGDYLGGAFAWVDRDRTVQLLKSSLENFRKKSDGEMKPVPENELPLYVGPAPAKGGLKIQLAYRDLPRGSNRYPQTDRIERPVNLGFLDLKPEEVREFLPEGKEAKTLSQALVKKISQDCLKDCARGQCNVDKKAFRSGEWTVKESGRQGNLRTIELRGTSSLDGGGVRFEPTIYGQLEYDEGEGKFVHFDLVAVGQRSGASEFNFRRGDEDAAPLGVAFRLFAQKK